MEGKENTLYSSPSLIQRNTPIRRVGLSRKRKSSTPEIPSNKLQSKISYKSPLSMAVKPEHVECEDKEKNVAAEITGNDSEKEKCCDSVVMAFKKKFVDVNQKSILSNEIMSSENVDSEITKLENLHEVWKNGCKDAMLHLLVLLKEKQPEFNSVEKVSVKLGIWDVIQSTFEKDPEFLTYEE